MTKAVAKKESPVKDGWAIRSSHAGQFVAVSPTKEAALAHARFLAVANLNAVSKKGALSQAQADKAVRKFLREKSRSAEA